MHHIKATIGGRYWAIRASQVNNAVLITKAKVVDIYPTEDTLYGDWCLCVEDPDAVAKRALFKLSTTPLAAFWSREGHLHETVEEALALLEYSIKDGVADMRNYFARIKENGGDPSTMDNAVLFPLDIMDAGDKEA